jgi:type IX secretion system PorP/SprF family membrane protein
MKRALRFLVFLSLAGGSLFGQSPQFSQFYANQIYLNPAFTGNTSINRIAANYRNQWAGVPGAFNSYSLAYDHNLAAYNMGLGLLAIRDQAGAGGLSYTNFSALGAYRFQIKENIMINAGLSYGFSIRSADVSKYTFGDQLINGGDTKANISQNKLYGDFGTGILVYGEKYWGGMSALHLNRPDESLVRGQSSRVPVLWSFHGGYNFALEESDKGEVLKSIIPVVNYKFSKKADQLDLGAYYQRRKLILGVWFRGLTVLKKNDDGSLSNDAVILLVGMRTKAMRIGYSYDITSSKLKVTDSYGSHEISITYEWPTDVRKKKKRKKNFIVPCPKF